MDWFKKTAGRIKHGHSLSDSRVKSALTTGVEVGKFDAAPFSAACCALGGRHDGTFGDGDEAWAIRRLWRTYEKSSQHARDTATTDASSADNMLIAYLAAFNSHFGRKLSESENLAMHTIDAKSADTTSPPLSPLSQQPTGHPHAALIAIFETLSRVAESFARCEADSMRTLMIIQHLEILSRYDGNRDAMVRHGALQNIITILGIAANQLCGDDGVGIFMEHEVQDRFFACVFCGLKTLQRCADPNNQWPSFVRNGLAKKDHDQSYFSLSGRATSVQFSDEDIQSIINTIFLLFNVQKDEDLPWHYILRIHCIDTIASLVVGHSHKVCSFLDRKVKGFDILTDLVGWPANLSGKLDVMEADQVIQRLRWEFGCQVLAWCLEEFIALYDNGVRQQFVARWLDHVADLYIWSSFVSTRGINTLNEDPDDQGILNLLGRFPMSRQGGDCESYGEEDNLPLFSPPMPSGNAEEWSVLWPDVTFDVRAIPVQNTDSWELNFLVDLARRFCLDSYHPPKRGIGPSLAIGFGEIPPASSQRSSQNARIPVIDESLISANLERTLMIFVRIFQQVSAGTEVRNAALTAALGEPKNVFPRLQLAFLKLLGELLICQDESDCGDDDEVRKKIRRSWLLKWMDDLSIWSLLIGRHFYMGGADIEEISGARRRLRNGILRLMVHCGSLPEDSNDKICEALLSLLRESSSSQEIVTDVCGSLCLIIRARPGETQEAFRRLNAFNILLPALSSLSEPPDPTQQYPLFALLDHVLDDNREMYIYSFLNRPILNALFTLLISSHVPASTFAQRHILKISNVLASEYPTYGQWGIIVPATTSPSTPMTPPTGDQETTPDVIRRYLDCFPAVVDEMSKAKLQTRLLQGLQGLVNSSIGKGRGVLKKALLEAKAFQYLLSILSVKVSVVPPGAASWEDHNEEIYHSLVETTLETLGTILQDDELCKNAFRVLRGYDEIRTRICVKGSRKCWTGLIDKAVFLIADGRTSTSLRVRNAHMLKTLFDFYEHCDDDLRVYVVRNLIDIAVAHEMNKAALHRTGAINAIFKNVLPLLTDKGHLTDVLQLLRMVAGYSVTVAEVKLMVQALRRKDLAISNGSNASALAPWTASAWADRRRTSVFDFHNDVPATANELPFWYDELLQTVVDIAQRRKGDLDLFAFDGTGGLSVKGLEKWPVGTGGWSFVTWIWVDGDVHDLQNQNVTAKEPRLFSLHTSNGENGMEIYLSQGALTLSIIRLGRQHVAPISDFPITTGEWHCIVVSHASPKLPWATASEAAVYIDGYLRWKGKLEYPEVDAYTIGRIGSGSGRIGTSRNQEAPSQYVNSFTGHMTALYLLEDVLISHQAASIYSMGPAHIARFRLDDDGKSSGDFESLEVGKVVMQFHPMATKVVSPKKERRGSVTVKRRRKHSECLSDTGMCGVIASATKCFQTAVRALGGIGILVPILAQVDSKCGVPRLQEERSIDASGMPGSGDEMDASVKKQRTRLFFDLIAAVMSGDVTHQESFSDMQGPLVIASLLQQNDAAGLSQEVFESLISVVQSTVLTPKLSDNIVRYIVFEPRIWTRASPEVQMEYYQAIHRFIMGDAAKYAQSFGAGFWTDALERFYRYSSMALAEQPKLRAVHALLRQFVLGIIKALLLSSCSPNDVGRVVQILSSSDDDQHQAELLRMVLETCVHHPESKLLERFLLQGGGEVLFTLLKNSTSENIKVLTMQMMLVVLLSDRIGDKWKRRIRVEDLAWFGTAAGNTTSLPSDTDPSLFGRILLGSDFTMRIYYGLLQLALEELVLDWETQEVLVAPVEMRTAKVKNVGYLHAIMELMSLDRVSLKLKGEIVRDILVIGCRNTNGERIRKVTGWQANFIRMLETAPGALIQDEECAPLLDASACMVADDEARVTNLTYEVLTTFSFDTFDKDKKAWRCVEDTVAYAWMIHRADRANAIIRTYLLRLLSTVRGEIGGGNWRNFSPTKMENIAHLLFFVEEIMFNHHDLRHTLIRELRAEDHKRLSFLPNLRELLTATSTGSGASDTTVHMSFPLGECRDLVEEYLEVLSSFIDFRMTHVQMTDNAEKSHSRAGGFVRLAVRILLSGFTVPDEAIWHMTLRHLIPLLDKHAATFSEGKKERGFYVLGHVHDSFIVAKRVSSNGDDNRRPDYRILLPLYMLVMTRWRDAIATLAENENPVDVPVVSEALLNEALADQEIFNHLVASPVWAGVYDTYLFPAMRAVEEEEFMMVSPVTKRFARAVRAICLRWAKDEAAIERRAEYLITSLQSINRRRKDEELQRGAEYSKDIEMNKRTVNRQLCFLWRILTQERGIWAPLDNRTAGAPDGNIKWKLDRAENALRMRRRQTPNWEFDDHLSASAKRDKTFKPEADSSPKQLSRSSTMTSMSLLEKRKSQMEKLRSQVASGLGVAPDLLKEISIMSLGSYVVEEETELGDEEWSVLNDDDVAAASISANVTATGSAGDRIIYVSECEMILLMTPVKGRLELTPSALTFIADIQATTKGLCESEREAVLMLLVDNDALLKERRWPLDDIQECFLRRYMLRKSAVEVFFVDKTNYLFNFPGSGKVASKERLKFLKHLVHCKPARLRGVDVRNNPPDIIKRSGITERWIKREISNFEYLMWLNTVSGRTYNDLTQYPVFPWVIRDYHSESLDLSDLSIYRDLSKPIGALDEARLQQYIERYKAFEDPTGRIKKFHYGTHYSSSASVVFYLLRLEPFTSLHISLQGGKFDHPDRQFHSIQSCWNSVVTGSGDVKELIPEFFYMPEFLSNTNGFDLGQKQTGEVLDNVILPPWAKTPEDFVRINREALEGDYVSEHLHEWIDLIWGYKQTGEEAVKAHNVFYYLTYEGAINIDAIKDPVERRSIEDQINNFGQTPSQLFKKPHAKRLPKKECYYSTLFDAPQDHRSYLVELKGGDVQFLAACSEEGRDAQSGQLGGIGRYGTGHTAAIPEWAGFDRDRVITVDGEMCLRSHKWNGGGNTSFDFEADNTTARKRKIPFQLASTTYPHSQLFAATPDGRYLIAGGCWDTSFHILHVDSQAGHGTPRTIDVVRGHRDMVTCAAIGEDGRTIVTGSLDTTVMAWELHLSSGAVQVAKDRRKVFCGHDDGITTIAVNIDHGLIVSGSKDGTAIIHTLYDARYLRTIHPSPEKPGEILRIRRVLITYAASIIVYTEVIPADPPVPSGALYKRQDSSAAAAAALGSVCYLHAYSVNGKHLRNRMFTAKLNDIKASRDGEFLVVADDRGAISILQTYNLHVMHRFDVSVSVLCLAISEDQQFLFLGRSDGKLLVIGHEGSDKTR